MDAQVAGKIQQLLDSIEQVVYGKHEVVKLCVIGLLARGHILIEDVPGIGKTTIAQSIAKSLDCTFNRVPVHQRHAAFRYSRSVYAGPEVQQL